MPGNTAGQAYECPAEGGQAPWIIGNTGTGVTGKSQPSIGMRAGRVKLKPGGC